MQKPAPEGIAPAMRPLQGRNLNAAEAVGVAHGYYLKSLSKDFPTAIVLSPLQGFPERVLSYNRVAGDGLAPRLSAHGT
jgi:hypothetical protein